MTFYNPITKQDRKYSRKYDGDRQIILDKLLDWAQADYNIEIPSHTLAGAAGTGKTTLLLDFVNNYKKLLAVSATTHKAVRIVERAIKKKGETIHSLCGLRPNFDIDKFDINNIQFNQQANPKLRNYSIVIIDECSQLNKDLVYFILKEAKQYRCKILFVGDKFQLPPINEHISKVFSLPNQFELLDIVRQEIGNPILELLSISRTDVQNHTFKIDNYLKLNKENIKDTNGYQVLQKPEFIKKILSTFDSTEFKTNIDSNRMLCYTNANVSDWNNFIRKELKDSVKPLIIGDVLTSYTTLVNTFLTPIIINSEDYIINDIMEYSNLENNLEGYMVNCLEVHSGKTTPFMFILNHIDKDNLNRFINILQRLRNNAINTSASNRSRLWKMYYDFKNVNLLLISLFNKQGQLMVAKDLDYAYAITTHKSQGSTFINTFINYQNIVGTTTGYSNTINNINLRNKLLYVGISRTQNLCNIL